MKYNSRPQTINTGVQNLLTLQEDDPELTFLRKITGTALRKEEDVGREVKEAFCVLSPRGGVKVPFLWCWRSRTPRKKNVEGVVLFEKVRSTLNRGHYKRDRNRID